MRKVGLMVGLVVVALLALGGCKRGGSNADDAKLINKWETWPLDIVRMDGAVPVAKRRCELASGEWSDYAATGDPFHVCRDGNIERLTIIRPNKQGTIDEASFLTKGPKHPNTVEGLTAAFGPSTESGWTTGSFAWQFRKWKLPGGRRINVLQNADEFRVEFSRLPPPKPAKKREIKGPKHTVPDWAPPGSGWPDKDSELLNPVLLSRYLGQSYAVVRAHLYKNCQSLLSTECVYASDNPSSRINLRVDDRDSNGTVDQIWWQAFSLSTEGLATYRLLRQIENTLPCKESDWSEEVRGEPSLRLGEGSTKHRSVSCWSGKIEFTGHFHYFSDKGNNSVDVTMLLAE